MAGVQKIPQSLFDAARVDGAGPLREFFAVTLPNLRGEIAVALTLTTIAALRNFDLVYITTQGGPGNSTSVPAFRISTASRPAASARRRRSASPSPARSSLIGFGIQNRRSREPLIGRREQP